ncbi:hydantoinase/oxoprolinase family protein [Loktanella sp. D2R18]|uniref:hydantoinase/oxoprolinase N-terminal domain-containing protein n=1 Tax=Rhodobacterales TaxID=204455 RepID=UPI000DEB3EC2|nr:MULTISPECIES: hydantoinase/oxoprolinase family protein [Rhodobacterales]MDO6591399.1 hydantoinase/oxoprolinase family protein [Yoonia sp. 1_MG-2023]RBW43532.1 hydantoinase/oxoprolinase family protein [Loktanella sp. D2R18]
MAYLLGVDTGGTYTDAVVLHEASDTVQATAKALTTRPDLSIGVGAAIDRVLADAHVTPSDIAMVSLSTTLATNALVEGHGGSVALIAIGFDDADLRRAGLNDAMGGDPVIALNGGHNHGGVEIVPLDLVALNTALDGLDPGVTAFAVAASFATRNPAHEIAVRDAIRGFSGKPVTCSHELSQGLGGPKRALTAVLNARLIGLIDGLISSCEAHLRARSIDARLMVVRGDGALISADVAREKPIETILSGPAASVAGASWLTGENNALVSDIGGTTTDVCLLLDGRPQIDPQGARVGPFRTMVEAVAMRTTGLGGDSEVHIIDGLNGGIYLGPRRLMPLSLAAVQFPELVHAALDRALAHDVPPADGGQLVIPVWETMPQGLDARETTIAQRLAAGPLRLGEAVQTRNENPALGRMIKRGFVILAGLTPSDAAHVLDLAQNWDKSAAVKAATLFARRRNGSGQRIAADPAMLGQMIVDQLVAQTVDCLLQASFAQDGFADDPAALTQHALTRAGLNRHQGILQMQLRLGVPVVGLGASAATYYGAVGDRLGAQMILPKHGEVANAIGAVVGQVRVSVTGSLVASDNGGFTAHLPDGPQHFDNQEVGLAVLETCLSAHVTAKAQAAGVDTPRISVDRDIKQAKIADKHMFIEAVFRVTASGRPRIATG